MGGPMYWGVQSSIKYGSMLVEKSSEWNNNN